jgi:hypothetical protein
MLLLRRKEKENAGECDVDWIQLAGDETGWGAVVNKEMIRSP